MKVMYIAPRFHTNQIDTIKGWKRHGDEVTFISAYRAPVEDYEVLEPVVLGYSPVFYPIDWIYMNILHPHDINSIVYKINHGFPPMLKLRRIIKEKKPDLVILRDRTLYSMAAYYYCKRFKIKAVLYNQSPVYDVPVKNDIKHKIVRGMTPKYRITPVMGYEDESHKRDINALFTPFVMEPVLEPSKKMHMTGGKLNLLLIGKFEPRKHHIMAASVVKRLLADYPNISLTMIGEATQENQKNYLKKVLKYIEDEKLQDYVKVVPNVPRNRMGEYYRECDLFLMPSTKEMASVSQTEAMSYSIAVVISDRNGSASCVEDKVTGFLFRDCDEEDLYQKTWEALKNTDRLWEMGKNGYEKLSRDFCFEAYYDNLMTLIEKV